MQIFEFEVLLQNFEFEFYYKSLALVATFVIFMVFCRPPTYLLSALDGSARWTVLCERYILRNDRDSPSLAQI